MNLKFETIVQIFRKIMQLNAVIILKSTNEDNRKIISKESRIKVHFVATFLNNFSIVFVTVLWNVDCISFDNLPKKYRKSFWLKMYPLIQNVAKFRSKCEKYKKDFCPELSGRKMDLYPAMVLRFSQEIRQIFRQVSVERNKLR